MNKGKVLIIVHNLHQPDTFFNIGAGYIVSVLKQHRVNVDVFDMAINDLNESDLANYLKTSIDYDLICLGFLSARFKETVEPLCKVINEYKGNAWLVLGGNGASAIPVYNIEQTKADVICIGESEETIVDVLECKINKGDLSKVEGIVYKASTRIVDMIWSALPRKPIKNLDSIPFPAWEEFDMGKYTETIKLAGMTDKDKCFPIVTSRGCTNKCTFCYRMHKGVRIRSIDNIIKEIKYLNSVYGITYFFIFDELFICSKQRIFDFAKALKDNNLNILYNCNARVTLFDEEIAKCLLDSGCVFVNFGFESTSQKVLDAMNKNAKVEQNVKCAEICKRIGLGMGVNILWGMPYDDEETLKNNVDFIMEYTLFDQCRTIRPVTPYPGCDLFWQAIASGQLKNEGDFFEKFKNSDLMTVNYTKLPTEKCYELLFEANKKLILYHYANTNCDFKKANELIQGFKDLYSGKDIKFRGARSDATNEDKRKIIK